MAQEPHSLEYTIINYDGLNNVFHYTCNPPSYKTLERHGIKPIGDQFNCGDPREILLIPSKLYTKMGYAIREADVKIVSETLLRRLGLKDRR
ncbi:hypothetical protein JXM83_06890 [Candidatus Woesearchaeota archaeon]|nr:hypothetical protein [Candidatus Woesearchaeota archaeon]